MWRRRNQYEFSERLDVATERWQSESQLESGEGGFQGVTERDREREREREREITDAISHNLAAAWVL
jgi:hypothetical protein